MAIQCECIKILALSSNILALTDQQSLRVSKVINENSFIINSKVPEKTHTYNSKSVISISSIRHILDSVDGLQENKNDSGADYIDLEFTKDAEKKHQS